MGDLMLNKVSYPIHVAQIMGKFNTGGIKSVLMNYYRNIDRNKIQFDFIVDNDSMSHDYSEIEALGGKVYEIPPVKDLFKYIPTLYKLLKTNNYKITHAYINTLNVFPMFVAFMARIPIRISENLSTSHSNERKTILKILLKPLSKLFPTNYAGCSELAAQWMFGEDALLKGKVKVFNNAINLPNFEYNYQLRIETRQKYGIEGMFVIGHIGRYNYQKNHDFLIDIFNETHKLYENVRLILIGYGELKEQTFEKIEALGLSDYVIDLGSREDISQFYNAMDLFLLPSFYEGLPVVGIEAQASGLPCLFSDEVTKEVKVTNNVEFISLDQSAKEWAERIMQYKGFQRKSKSNMVREAGFDIKSEGQALEKYYLKALRLNY